MNGDEEPQESPRLDPDAPLPNRFSRSTLTGCLGLLLVLTLPLLLYIPVERLGLPLWFTRLIPLVGVAAVAYGVWLLARVPGAGAQPTGTPLRPLTSRGRVPLRERPATAANRVGLLATLALTLCCTAGYFLVNFAPRGSGLLPGTVLASVCGAALLVYAGLAAARVVALPTWRWVRTPLGGGPSMQALPPAVVGAIALVWGLFLAAGAGYAWAPVGVGLLILGGALAGSLWQRIQRAAPDPRQGL